MRVSAQKPCGQVIESTGPMEHGFMDAAQVVKLKISEATPIALRRHAHGTVRLAKADRLDAYDMPVMKKTSNHA